MAGFEFNHDTSDISAVTGTITIDGASPGGGDAINVETLAAGKTLTNADASIQVLDPNGSSRNVDLPAEEADLKFTIVNPGTANNDWLVIRDDAAGAVTKAYPGQSVTLMSDGTSWYSVGAQPGVDNSGTNTRVAIGYEARATSTEVIAIGGSALASGAQSVSIGHNAIATSTDGVAIGTGSDALAASAISIGNSSNASDTAAIAIGDVALASGANSLCIGDDAIVSGDRAIAIGNATDATQTGNIAIGDASQATGTNGAIAIGDGASVATNYGIALGRNASTSGSINNAIAMGLNTSVTAQEGICIGGETNASNRSGVAIGYGSKTFRAMEFCRNLTTGSASNGVEGTVGLYGTTAATTPTELLCGAISGERITVQPSSIMTFQASICGRDNTTGNCCSYIFEGAIKRDGANNTALVGSVSKKIVGEDDAAFDSSVSADDTNEALVFTVTNAAANSTRWVGSVRFVEVRF